MIVPSIFSTTAVGHHPFFSGNLYGNVRLHRGEVFEVIDPKSPKSVSKKFYEYNVLVSEFEAGTITQKMYKNCLLINSLCGADSCSFKLRAATKYDETFSGDGSRVVVACIEGSTNQALIIGGLRDERAGGDEDLGQHYEFEYNGVKFTINDDGSYQVVTKGKTDNLGKQHKDANEDGVGTTINVAANGTVKVATPNEDQVITIDNSSKTIKIKANTDITIDGQSIHLGNGASEPAVLGNQLLGILNETMSALLSLTVIVSGSGSTPPVNAGQFAAIQAKLQQILSNQTFVKL